MTGYLKMDSTRISFGEYWRLKPGPAFIVLALSKLLRLRFPSMILIPAVARNEAANVTAQPPELVDALGEPIRACQERGYELSLWSSTSAAGQTRDGANREVQMGLASRLLSGDLLVTGYGRSLFKAAPGIDEVSLPGRSFGQVVDAHEERVNDRRSEITSCGDVRWLVQDLEQRQIDMNAARRVYVPAAPEDVARLRARQ